MIHQSGCSNTFSDVGQVIVTNSKALFSRELPSNALQIRLLPVCVIVTIHSINMSSSTEIQITSAT